MPSEPDNKMDELLRAYARKRLEDAGGPPELHPATRRLLQAEAARLRPRPDASQPKRWTWLLAHWPRVAISVGLFAVLGLVVWNILPGRENSPSEMTLALEKRSLDAAVPRFEPVAVPAVRLEYRASQNRGLSEQETGKGEPAPEPAADRNSQNLARRKSIADADRILEPRGAERTLKVADSFDVGKIDATAVNDEFSRARPGFGGAAASGGLALAKDTAPSTEQTSKLAKNAPAGTALAAQSQGLLQKPAVLLALQDAPSPVLGETIAPAATPPPAPQAPSPASRTRMVAAAPSPSAAAAARPLGSFAEPPPGATGHYRFQSQSGWEDLAAGKKKIASTAPLSTFEVEQSGDVVRVIDFDGSVYSGRLLVPGNDTRARLGASDLTDKRLQAETQERRVPVNGESDPRAFALSLNARARTNLSFRVAGTNRTSGHRIIFEGALTANAGTAGSRDLATDRLPAAPAPASSPARSGVRPAASVSGGAATTPGKVQESPQLVGRLRIGASDEVIIRAVPVAK